MALPLAGSGSEGQFIDFRLTARRDAKAAKAFPKQSIDGVRLYRPVSICTDKAPGYRKVIRDLNHRYDPHFESILHIDRKWRSSSVRKRSSGPFSAKNRIESDHAALKRLLGTRQSFRFLRSAKATILGVETIRTIKSGHVSNKAPSIRGEIDVVRNLFAEAAREFGAATNLRSRPTNATVPIEPTHDTASRSPSGIPLLARKRVRGVGSNRVGSVPSDTGGRTRPVRSAMGPGGSPPVRRWQVDVRRRCLACRSESSAE